VDRVVCPHVFALSHNRACNPRSCAARNLEILHVLGHLHAELQRRINHLDSVGIETDAASRLALIVGLDRSSLKLLRNQQSRERDAHSIGQTSKSARRLADLLLLGLPPRQPALIGSVDLSRRLSQRRYHRFPLRASRFLWIGIHGKLAYTLFEWTASTRSLY
jgi:hypothetical protein